MNRPRPRSLVRFASPLILVAALAMLGPVPGSSIARGQWIAAPGFGWGYGHGARFGGFGPGFGPGWGYGFGPTYAGVGYGFGAPLGLSPGFGAGYGIYPGAFSVLNQPDIQSGLAYNALATGRASPYAVPAGPFGPGLAVGPFGYAGAAYSNPYFAGGLTPLAVQSAQAELLLRRAEAPVRFQIPLPPPVDPGNDAGPDD